MNQKNKRKFQVSYNVTNNLEFGWRGYFETIYLKEHETEEDLSIKINQKIRSFEGVTTYRITEVKI